MKIAVLGGGNGSFAAAGDFALGGHEVRLWRRDAGQVAAHRARGSRILLKDVNGRHDIKLASVTTDIAEAVGGAALVLCPTPAFAQSDIAKQLAPHLREGQVVLLPPATFGSTIFAKAAHDAGNHADVLKHTVLTAVLRYMNLKDKPYRLVDTHAGAGGYSLQSRYAKRKGEFEQGIARLWDRSDLPALVADYAVAGLVDHAAAAAPTLQEHAHVQHADRTRRQRRNHRGGVRALQDAARGAS